MDPIVIVTALAAVLAYLALGFSVYVYRRQQQAQEVQQREQERRNQWERQLQEQQQKELILNQPRLAAIGSSLAIHPEVVPQWLQVAAGQQKVTITNRGKTTPSSVHAVLFTSASNLPAGSPPQARTDELFGTYWEGELDDGPELDKQVELVLYSKRSPLRGDMRVIPDRTLFAPPEPDTGTALGTALRAHHYFGRLTLTYRDAFGRLLACDFDGDSVPHENTLTQKWRPGVGPTAVQCDLRMLAEEEAP
jgi:type II secretory pathway pseudopilin PulG